jgi:F0F1-type ATP synthase membrane subunit b/b'
MREARAEVYREQEETRKRWLVDQASQVDGARERTGQTVQQAKEQIAAEVTGARQMLAESASALADQIATTVLSRRVG